MKNRSSEMEEWRILYQQMEKIRQLAPWDWMEESDIFGVQNPQGDEIGFVSIMGQMGEHYAVAVYQGAEGLMGFFNMQEAGPDISAELLFEIPQLQASFEEREILHPADRKIIKLLGLSYRGSNAWPLFRSFRPGFFPWYLERDERSFLIHVLEQTIGVARRFKDNRSLLNSPQEDEFLVRIPDRQGEKLNWRERFMKIYPPAPQPLSITLETQSVERLRAMPVTRHKVEVDLFMSPLPIREKAARPYFPYLLMMVDSDSGMILANELLSPVANRVTMWASILPKLVEHLVKMKIRPRQLQVKSEVLYQMMIDLDEVTGLQVRLMKSLPGIDAAREGLQSYFNR